MKKILLTILAIVLFLLLLNVVDQTIFNEIVYFVFSSINFVLAIVGVVALGYLAYGGFRYVKWGSNEIVKKKAKRIIINAVICICVIGILYVLFDFFIFESIGGSVPVGAV